MKSRKSLVGWLITSGALALLACVAILHANSADPSAPASPSDLISWGSPAATFGDEFIPADPVFVAGARKLGGDWFNTVDGITGWSVSPADPDYAALEIDLDRTALTNDLNMQVVFFDSSDASLQVDLIDEDGIVIVANVSGDLLTGSGAIKTAAVTLPLAQLSEVATIQLRCDYGGVAVYFTRLSIWQAAQTGTGPGQGSQTVTEGTSSSNSLDNSGTLTLSAAGSDTNASGSSQGLTVGTDAGVSNALPLIRRDAGKVVYVDARTGSDWYSGRVSPATALILDASPAAAGVAGSTGDQALLASNTVAEVPGQAQTGVASLPANALLHDGPKATIAAGLMEATPDDTLVIRAGTYHESLNLAGRKGAVRIEGSVNLSGKGQGRPDTVPHIAADAQGAGTNSVQQVIVIKGEAP